MERIRPLDSKLRVLDSTFAKTIPTESLPKEAPIAAAENTAQVSLELSRSELLGATKDGKRIYLFDATQDSACMREIGRLREVTYRQVGEGSGKARDLDQYDTYYRHIVLWNDEQQEIIGAYRIGEAWQIAKTLGVDALYSQSIFKYTPEFEPYLSDAIELGRSFVQPDYWGSRALDYLWQGIGAYLKQNPQVKWMFGPVSISDALPQEAKEKLVYFYRTWFGCKQQLVAGRNPWQTSEEKINALKELYPGEEYPTEFRQLRKDLASLGTAVPTLYKQYSEFCEIGGVQFMDFSVDADFANTIDGFILVEIDKIKPEKRARYMGD